MEQPTITGTSIHIEEQVARVRVGRLQMSLRDLLKDIDDASHIGLARITAKSVTLAMQWVAKDDLGPQIE